MVKHFRDSLSHFIRHAEDHFPGMLDSVVNALTDTTNPFHHHVQDFYNLMDGLADSETPDEDIFQMCLYVPAFTTLATEGGGDYVLDQLNPYVVLFRSRHASQNSVLRIGMKDFGMKGVGKLMEKDLLTWFMDDDPHTYIFGPNVRGREVIFGKNRTQPEWDGTSGPHLAVLPDWDVLCALTDEDSSTLHLKQWSALGKLGVAIDSHVGEGGSIIHMWDGLSTSEKAVISVGMTILSSHRDCCDNHFWDSVTDDEGDSDSDSDSDSDVIPSPQVVKTFRGSLSHFIRHAEDHFPGMLDSVVNALTDTTNPFHHHVQDFYSLMDGLADSETPDEDIFQMCLYVPAFAILAAEGGGGGGYVLDHLNPYVVLFRSRHATQNSVLRRSYLFKDFGMKGVGKLMEKDLLTWFMGDGARSYIYGTNVRGREVIFGKNRTQPEWDGTSGGHLAVLPDWDVLCALTDEDSSTLHLKQWSALGKLGVAIDSHVGGGGSIIDLWDDGLSPFEKTVISDGMKILSSHRDCCDNHFWEKTSDDSDSNSGDDADDDDGGDGGDGGDDADGGGGGGDWSNYLIVAVAVIAIIAVLLIKL